MKFLPIAPWWIVLVIGLGLCGFIAWQMRGAKRDKRLWFAWLRRLGIAGLLVLMALGPSLPGASSPAGMINLDVVFAVDTTTSMGAADYASGKERLDGAKKDILGIAEAMAGARFGIIAFDRDARTILPMTTDLSALNAAIEGLVRENSVHSTGSSIDMPLQSLKDRFSDNKKRNSQRPQILFYLGDGEQTASKQPESFAPLKQYVSGGAVLGYGTEKGSKIIRFYGFRMEKEDDPCLNGEKQYNCYVFDSKAEDAVSKLDEKNLNAIASSVGIPYSNRNGGGSYGELVDTSGAQRVADGSREVTSYSNLYYVLAFPLALLVAWECMYIKSRIDEIPGGKARRK